MCNKLLSHDEVPSRLFGTVECTAVLYRCARLSHEALACSLANGPQLKDLQSIQMLLSALPALQDALMTCFITLNKPNSDATLAY